MGVANMLHGLVRKHWVDYNVNSPTKQPNQPYIISTVHEQIMNSPEMKRIATIMLAMYADANTDRSVAVLISL